MIRHLPVGSLIDANFMKHGTLEPTCKALLLCERTIVEKSTSKVSVIGITHSYRMSQLPGQSRPGEVYLQITDAEGRYDFVVEICDLKGGELTARSGKYTMDIQNRLQPTCVLIPIPSIPFQHAGAYDFVVMANGRELDRQKVDVLLLARDSGDREG